MNILSYDLPSEKIALKPKSKRSESKLLFYNKGEIKNKLFSDLPSLLNNSTTLVLNETKVINARLFLFKPTGSRIEVFCLEPHLGDISVQLSCTGTVKWNCLLGGAKKWKEGPISHSVDHLNGNLVLTAEKISDQDGVFTLQFSWSDKSLTFGEILEIFGQIPLPPYIKRELNDEDSSRYQTVFAKNSGSVAAPTASLHFTDDILKQLSSNGIETAKISLHVGAGTFKPISTDVDNHLMHQELFYIDQAELIRLVHSSQIIAVGTTAVRTLESLYILANQIKTLSEVDLNSPQIINQWEWKTQEDHFLDYQSAFSFLLDECIDQSADIIQGYTSLMIVRGFKYKVITGLITNFHMPKSSLLHLVQALVGNDLEMIYEHALNSDYRFLSYGDSSLLIP